MCEKITIDVLREHIGRLVPKFSLSSHKGQAGKIGILGGSKSYTGAPYYAAISALRMGADLATVFCPPSAANPIKSYSPELMVHPLMRTSDMLPFPEKREEVITEVVNGVDEWLQKIYVLVVGPGLSRDELLLECAGRIINQAKKKQLPLVIDGDALWLVNKQPQVIAGYPLAVLTPNAMEFKRLWDSLCPDQDLGEMSAPIDGKWGAYMRARRGGGALPVDATPAEHTAKLAQKLGGVTILRKGQVDIISDGKQTLFCSAAGSPRRCGGQGDMVAGAVGLFLSWASPGKSEKKEKGQKPEDKEESKKRKREKDEPKEEIGSSLLAAFGGTQIIRQTAQAAFLEYHRSALTTDMITQLPRIMQLNYPVHYQAEIDSLGSIVPSSSASIPGVSAL